MIPYFLDDKDYILDVLQIMFLVITCIYLVIFVAIVIFYIIYVCKGVDCLYYVLLVLINLMLLFAIWEIINAALFGGVRLFCHEGPRALNFIFTGTYILNGNTNSYPAKFGNNDEMQIKLFDICLNGDGDLTKLFFTSNDISSLKNLKDDASNYYNKMINIFDNSNILINSYDEIENNAYLNSIIKLEQIQNNLYIASEGFGDNDIKTILNNITSLLTNCEIKNEYYVVKESECPSGSTVSNTISTASSTVHCYIIQNLDSTEAKYTSSVSDCKIDDINTYINNAVNFIKEINNILIKRIDNIKNLQKSYSNTWKYLKNEITLTSESLNETYNILNNDLGASSSNATNCSSVRYDLIKFSDYFSDKTEYRARIILVFSAFAGVFGFVLFYTFLIVLNSFNEDNLYENDFSGDYGYSYTSKKKNKIKFGLGLKDDDDDDDDDGNKSKIKTPSRKEKTPPRNQKVEMSYMSKGKKNEEDNSDDDE